MDALAISHPPLTETGRPISGSEAAPEDLRKLDWVGLGVVSVVVLILRVLYVHALHWNSDEPQHTHVVWGWATGRLPYRDVFDNHSPLFGFLFSPLFRLMGERDDIVDAMRWSMLPLFAVSVWCLYKLGTAAFSRRTALWATILGALFPNWFLKMVEFRTDVLWTTLWLVTLVILVTGRLSVKRLFFAGLCLGATFSVSMKTTLMLVTIGAAAAVTWALPRLTLRFRSGSTMAAGLAPKIGAALCGLILIPAAFITFFVSQGATEKMYYCVILHNLTGSHGAARILRHFVNWHSLLIPITLGVGCLTLPLFRTDPVRASRRLFLVCVAGFFSPILVGIWSNVTPQDYMPLWPFCGAAAGVAIVSFADWSRRRFSSVIVVEGAVLLACAGFEIWSIYGGGFRFARDPSETPPAPTSLTGRPNLYGMELIKEARTLTNPDEYVMDAKGESIYRPRPYWYVLETLTRKRLFDGVLPDEVPQRLIDTGTAVVEDSGRMMPATLKFVAENYISIGVLRVAGKMLPETATDTYEFDIAVPQEYTLLTRGGVSPSGALDGQPFKGPRFLEAGHHRFQRVNGKGRMAVVWARAIEKGYSPFRPVIGPASS